MDARIAGQISGVGHLIPTRGESPVDGTRPQTVDAVKRAPNAGSAGDVPAQVFDANGDGTVEHWSYAHGGDSYTTFKPPPSGATGANARKVGHPPPGTAPPSPPAHSARHANAHSSTAAAVHHAREAYQRDGGTAARDTHATASAPVTPAATAATSTPAPQVTQPGATPALRSPRP